MSQLKHGRNGREANSQHPCPVCSGTSWCLTFSDGGVNCYRAGCGLERTDQQGNLYWYHSAQNENEPGDLPPEKPTPERANADQLDRAYRALQGQLTLSKVHREALLGRGLSEAAINGRGFKSLGPDVANSQAAGYLAGLFPFWQKVPGLVQRGNGAKAKPALSRSRGLLLFLQDLDGRIQAVQVRADDADLQANPDRPRYTFLSSKSQGGPSARACASWWGPVERQQVEAVRTTEGAFKALLAFERTQVPSIAAGAGVGSMASSEILDWLEQLAPKRVLFTPDQDALLKAEVTQRVKVCLQRLMSFCQARGVEVLVETWQADLAPEQRYKGIDDALQQGCELVTIPAAQYLASLPFVEAEETMPPEPAGPKIEWEPPIPLEGPPEKPTFPLEALPGLAGRFADAMAEAYQIPHSYAATLVLGVASTALLKRVVADPGFGSTMNLNEWFLTVMESGSGKSTGIHAAFAPVYAYEKRKLATKQAAKEPEDGPIEFGLISSDPTPEALEKRLRANQGRYAVANAEAGDLFAILAGKYTASGSGANIGLFLKSYSGECHRSDRVLRGATYIQNPRLALTLALQPSSFERVHSSTEFQERGLMARFLIDQPDSLLGYRKSQPTPIHRDLKDEWHNLVTRLLNIEPPVEDDEPAPYSIHFSPHACSALKWYREWAEAGLRPEGFWAPCREYGSRSYEHLLKLAGLLHCLAHPASPWDRPISEETVSNAQKVLGYYSEQVLLASGSVVEKKRNSKLTYLLERIKSKPEWRESFRARDLLVLVKKTRGFETTAALSHYLDQLCESGHLEKTVSQKSNKPSVVYLVSPFIFENDPQYPQPQAKPYGKRLSPVGGFTHSPPTNTHSPPTNTLNHPQSEGRQTPIVGSVGAVGDGPPTDFSYMGKGFSGCVGIVGQNLGEGPEEDLDRAIGDLI